jgi:hypothetical protein
MRFAPHRRRNIALSATLRSGVQPPDDQLRFRYTRASTLVATAAFCLLRAARQPARAYGHPKAHLIGLKLS